MRVRNAHTAPIEGIAPGEEGNIPEAGARALLAAGVLQRVGGDAPRATGEGFASLEEMRASFQDAYDARTRELRAAEKEAETLRARVAELEATGSKTVKELRADLAAAKARVAELEAAVPPPAPPVPTPPAEG